MQMILCNVFALTGRFCYGLVSRVWAETWLQSLASKVTLTVILLAI